MTTEEISEILKLHKAWRNYYNCMYRTMDRGQFFNGHWGGEPKNGTCAKVLAWTELPLYNPTGGDPMTKQQLVD